MGRSPRRGGARPRRRARPPSRRPPLISLSPRVAATLGEASGAAWGAAETARASRRAECVRRNLSVVLDRTPKPDEIRSVFATFGRSLAAFGAAPAATGRWPEIAGKIASERLAPGVLCSPHLGAWELGATLLAARGIPTASIVRRMAVGNVLYDRLRGKVLPIPLESPRRVLRAIAEGRTVCFAMDEPVGSGVVDTFFGRMVSFAAGAFRLARAARAPIFVAAGLWNAEGRIDIPVLGPFDADDVAGVIGALEDLIRRAPTQWVLFEDRFR